LDLIKKNALVMLNKKESSKTMKYLTLLALLALLSACGGGGGGSPTPALPDTEPALPDSNTFPGASWQTYAAADLGIAQSGVTAALDYAFADGRNTQGVVIVKNGVIIGERYTAGSSADTMATSWSTGKSFASTLIGIAVDEGLIGSIDESAENYLPPWVNTDREAISVRAILEMRSGLGLASNDPTDSAIYVSGGTNGDQLAYALDRVPASTPRTNNWVYQNSDSM
jgi:CubicO group peptidase (beta-lactamase class C family)